MRIYKEFLFEAAHFLPSAPPGHPNSRIHGHSFRARVTIDGEPDPTTGVLLHFDDIEAALAEAREALDHHFLNEVEGLENPTSEILAKWLWDRIKPGLPSLAQITVHETCDARCEYTGT